MSTVDAELHELASRDRPLNPLEHSEPAQDDDTPGTERDEQSLPPYDGGIRAWRMLVTAFVFEALLWGFPLSFGVFQNYYSQQPQFRDSPYISVVGSTASGISYLAAPIAIPLTKRYSHYRRQMIWIGWPLCLLGLVAGSFANSLATLIVTQGIMYGVGFSIFYYPILSMVNEFWIARRGMAYGLLCSASGVSGAILPFCIEKLLQRYGYATTLRVIAIGLVILTGPLIPFLKGRVPESPSGVHTKTDWTFLKSRLFWIYSASNFAMGMGYFFPSLYLPSYVVSRGMNPIYGAILLAVMSVSQVLGQMSFGYLSDHRLPLNVLATSSTLIAAVAVYICWGLAQTFSLLVVFAFLYGFFGGGYTALWARMGSRVSSEPTAAFTAFGLLNFGKGVGNVLSGPIGGALLSKVVNTESYGAKRYEAVVLFTGSAMVISAATIVLCYLDFPSLRSNVINIYSKPRSFLRARLH